MMKYNNVHNVNNNINKNNNNGSTITDKHNLQSNIRITITDNNNKNKNNNNGSTITD